MQKMRVVSLRAPAMSLGLVPSEPMMDRDENVMLAGVPSLPLSRSNGGIAKSSRSHHGCAKLMFWKELIRSDYVMFLEIVESIPRRSDSVSCISLFFSVGRCWSGEYLCWAREVR